MQKLDDGTKLRETFDLGTEQWRAAVEADLSGVPADLCAVMFDATPHGELAWQVFGGTLRYAAGLLPEIADDIVNIDNAIRWGFNWAQGPFELIDTIGPRRMIDRIRSEGAELPSMLEVLDAAGASSFYRTNSQGVREYLTVTGEWSRVPA